MVDAAQMIRTTYAYIAAYFIAQRLKNAGDVMADGWAGGYRRCSLTDLNHPDPY